jgi:carbonic anhydrase
MTARIRSVAVLVVLLSAVLTAAGPESGPAPLTARQALGLLKAGNDRFARNVSKPVSMSVNRRQEIADAQHPVAMVLSCADSRVPPEHVFNVGLGDLFVIRTAGQVVDRSILATIEYGATDLRVPLLVVMGHESCGAVKAAAEAKAAPESQNLDFLLRAIQAARRQAPTAEDQQDRDDIKGLVLANVEQVINEAMAKSPLLRKLVAEGKLDVVGAYYELVSGRVMFSEPVPPGGARGAGETPVRRLTAPGMGRGLGGSSAAGAGRCTGDGRRTNTGGAPSPRRSARHRCAVP